MKWIRRRPRVWAQCGTAVVCVIALISVGVWISGPSNHDESTAGRWLREKTNGQTGPFTYRLRSSCFVIDVDGRVQILGDGDVPSEDDWREHQDHLYHYLSYSRRSGFCALTSMSIRHRLFKSPSDDTTYPFASRAFSRRGARALTRDDAAYMAIDPPLSRRSWIYEDRTLWNGYAINAIPLMAILVLTWNLAWVPFQILHQIRKRRFIGGLCPFCCYDVSATPGRCPECGWGHEVGVDEQKAE